MWCGLEVLAIRIRSDFSKEIITIFMYIFHTKLYDLI